MLSFHNRILSIKSCLTSKVIFHQQLSSIKGCLQSKLIFHQWSYSINCSVFHQELSSIKGPLPLKVFFYQVKPSTKFQTCSLLPSGIFWSGFLLLFYLFCLLLFFFLWQGEIKVHSKFALALRVWQKFRCKKLGRDSYIPLLMDCAIQNERINDKNDKNDKKALTLFSTLYIFNTSGTVVLSGYFPV